MPAKTATAGEVWTALDGQTGRLDTANSNKAASFEIVDLCEKRDAATVRRLVRPWWKLWER